MQNQDKYKCVKSCLIPRCDGDGFETDEYFCVDANTVWSIPEDKHYRLVGGAVRLENNDIGWIEISKETLNENFEPIENDKKE